MLYNEQQEMNRHYKVAIYNRCSTDDEKQANALELQAKQSRELCLNRGWTVINQYVEAVSGTTTKGRTEYMQMLEDMKTDKWEVLVIKSLDRLMRNNGDWYKFLDAMATNRKKLFIYMENKFFDMGRDGFLSGIQVAMNAEFSRNLSAKIKNSHRYRQEHKSGLNITRDIYGWTKVAKDKYELNEEEAKYYRIAMQLAREGLGFYEISIKLYNMGARTADGKKIDGTVWKNRCLSERSYGTVILHKTEMNFDIHKREEVPKEEWVYVENALPPIVTKEEWEQTRAVIMARSKTDNPTPYAIGKYPLSGKIFCGQCGAKYHRFLSRRRDKDKVIIWKCASAYRNGRNKEKTELACLNENVEEKKLLELVEKTSEEYLGNLFGSEDNIIDKCLKLIRQMLNKNNSSKKLDSLKKELRKQENKKDRLYEKLMDGVIDDENFKKYSKDVETKIESLITEISLIKVNSAALDINEQRLLKIKETIESGELIKQAKGKCLLDMIDKITVNPNATITIYYNRYKLLGLVEFINLGSDDKEEYKTTVEYDGHRSLKERTNDEKRRLIEEIRKEGRRSYAQYGKLLGISKIDVGARMKELFNRGCISRNEFGELSVIKDWTDEW
ncbi:MAG: recombinase family protein [Oscillospiraceae bacterium]|nr:recombinase family protein [Oscillospiraceae bacterium]